MGQHISDFLDDDEREEQLGKPTLRTAADYDTFGAGAAATAGAALRREEAAAAARGAGVPLLVPKDVLKPVVSSIGIQLLQKMGWRQVSWWKF